MAHIISSIDKTSGGPARSATHLLSYLSQTETALKLNLHTGFSPNPILKKFNQDSIGLTFYRTSLIGQLKKFNSNIQNFQPDLFHGHGIWQMPVHQMAKTAQKLNVPYIISPRGMLEPWSLQQGKLKKKLALKLFQYKDLKKAACIHVTAVMEAKQIRALGFKNPIAIIPNGIPLKDFPLKKLNKLPDNKSILFLSRIHPKKGLELLIESWSQLRPNLTQEWDINIIGNGDKKYIKQLNELISSKGLSNTIQIKQPIYGLEKVKAYQEASLFVLPTYSENFGIVIAEALASGTPVITTQGTPWQELETHNCGWWINTGVEPLKNTLEEALTTSIHDFQQMGQRGRQLVEQKYIMQVVADQMFELYNWILNKAEKPNFVLLD